MALDIAMAGVIVSLAAIAVFTVFAVWASLATMAGALRLARRRWARVSPLSRWAAVRELADIDEALDRVMAAELKQPISTRHSAG